MPENIQNYFTTGELSQLCKIPRKTLLYYDKLGLIAPEIIDENGYRYYKRSQLFLLQLILTLRQLGLPLAQIREYLAHRSPITYGELFQERINFFAKEIEHMKLLTKQLQESLHEIEALAGLTLNQIKEEQCQQEYLFISSSTQPAEGFKNRSAHIANMFAELNQSVPLTAGNFGYIYDNKVLDNGEQRYLCHYFYTLKQGLASPHCYLKPAGRYLTLYFQGVYMFNSKKHLRLLQQYIIEHKLSVTSPLYVTSLSDYWTADDIDKYIYKLALRLAD